MQWVLKPIIFVYSEGLHEGKLIEGFLNPDVSICGASLSTYT